jgi:hypothetical protein
MLEMVAAPLQCSLDPGEGRQLGDRQSRRKL